MGTSIAHAVRMLGLRDDARDVTALLIAACDMPSADVAADVAHVTALIDACDGGSRRVASAWTDEAGAQIMGIPAVLPRGDWPALEVLTGETGARTLLREPGGLSVFIRTRHYDLDTPDALEAWRAAERSGAEPSR
jgi:molybdenum cofactor cytidylyltransferase/nicotine blue oxidoreductase